MAHQHTFTTIRSFQRKGEAPGQVGECDACGATVLLAAVLEPAFDDTATAAAI